MSLTKEVVIDKIEVLENGTLQIRQATRIVEDGEVLSTSYHRHCLSPGDDLSNEDARVSAVATSTWTPEVVAAYKAALPVEVAAPADPAAA